MTSSTHLPAGLDALLNSKETADYMRTSEAKLRQDRYLGRGPKYIRNGRRILYRVSDIRAYLEANVHGN